MRTFRRWFIALIAGAGLLAACGPSIPPAPPARTEVVYKLDGYCRQSQFDPTPGAPCVGSDIFVTYANASGGISQIDTVLPFRLKFNRKPHTFVYLSAQLQGTGAVRCAITSSRKGIVQTSRSDGTFVIAGCSGNA